MAAAVGGHLKKAKEKPLFDERIPHPYREFVKELRDIKALLVELNQKLPVAVPLVPPVVVRPGVPAVLKVPALQLSKEEFMNIYIEALEKHGALKFADDLYVQTVDLSTDRSTDAKIEELTKLKNIIALTIFRNTGIFDLYINEKDVEHKLTFDALTYPQTFLLAWFHCKTLYVGNSVQAGLSAKLIGWKRLS